MDKILEGVISSAIYGILGIILMGIGFLVIKLVTPFSIKKEIEDDQNTSLGIIIAGVIIGIAIIISAAIVSFETKVVNKIYTVQKSEKQITKTNTPVIKKNEKKNQ